MDAGLARAAEALRRGDPLSTLTLTRERDEPLALAMRAVALAQIDERRAAREHLARAERGFTAAGAARSALRARLAEAEIAVDDHDLVHARTRLLAIAAKLRALGDHPNAAWAIVVAARAAALQGDHEGVGLLLARCRDEARGRVPAHVLAVLAMAEADHHARALEPELARAAATRARASAARAAHPALAREVARFVAGLDAPLAELPDGRPLRLADVAAILRHPSGIVVDACRARIVSPSAAVDLSRRPLLFDLAAAVARAWPASVHADELARQVFGARAPNASHDARLRVELGRLRGELGAPLGRLLVLEKRAVRWVAPALTLLLPLVPRREARLRALLGDGRAWPIKALSDATGQSPRTVQRMLKDLADRGLVSALGNGRARSYALEGRVPKIASWMLLPSLASES